MARHPWVAQADHGIRFGVQVVLGPTDLAGLPATGRLVEALGIDGLFIFDHPAVHPDPWICLSLLAGVTERVRLGSFVNCVSYRHPALLARMAADLDTLSGGRLLLGLGIGWLQPEFRALDQPYASAGERFAGLEEAIAIIEGGWGAEPFSFSGHHFSTDALRIVPPPLQQPRPPLVIGGSGERVTLRLVARYADACNINENQNTETGLEAVGGASTVARKLETLRRHCDEVGRPYEEVLRSHFSIRLVLAPSETALATKLDRLARQPSNSPGTRRARPSTFVTGTPERVAAYYRTMVEVGIQYFVAQVDAADEETLHLLATEVMPRVR